MHIRPNKKRIKGFVCLAVFSVWTLYQLWKSFISEQHLNGMAGQRNMSRNEIVPTIKEIRDIHTFKTSKSEMKTPSTEKSLEFDFKSCKLKNVQDTSGIRTPFKIFIYELPSKFNTDIIQRLMNKSKCYSLEYCGVGEKLFDTGKNGFVHDTHQFSLEVVLHHKLLHSPYRTLNPDKADIFYIPAYVGLHCMEFSDNAKSFIAQLFDYLKQSTYYQRGKPHFSSVSKIEREMCFQTCPYFVNPETAKITHFGIEKENSFISPFKHAISVPYPSYVHYVPDGNTRTVPNVDQRNVFVLLAAGARRSNRYRNLIMDQIQNKTKESYEKYINNHQKYDIIMLYTNECSKEGKWTTIPWMRHSVFCLQPPGDSPTRKSFYDAILSGCIPVLFPYIGQTSVWAFNDVFNYSEFTVNIPYETVKMKNGKIIDILKTISYETIVKLHNKVKEVSQWFQYSIIDGQIHSHTDAMQVILKLLDNIYNFTKAS